MNWDSHTDKFKNCITTNPKAVAIRLECAIYTFQTQKFIMEKEFIKP